MNLLDPTTDYAHLLREPLFQNRGHLLGSFEEVGGRLGYTKDVALRLFMKLPLDLRSAPTAVAQIDQKRRYLYGKAYNNLGTGKSLVSSEQFPEVETLFRALLCFESLNSEAWKKWMGRLENPKRHAAALAEIQPLERLLEGTRYHNRI